MNIMPKQEICENIPVSLPSLSFDSLIADMKKMKLISNEKLLALESRLEAAENEARMLRKENVSLKSALEAKERDCKLFYDQYQSSASSLLQYKTKVAETLQNLNSPEVEENREEIVALGDPDSTVVQSCALQSPKTPIPKKERPIAKAKKRPWSEISGWKSMGPQSKIATPTHFRCTFCPDSSHASTSFESIENYRSHIYEVHPERKFVCNLCPYTSKKGSHMRAHHQRNHTVVHNHGYDCKLCEMSFAESRSLAIHFNLFH